MRLSCGNDYVLQSEGSDGDQRIVSYEENALRPVMLCGASSKAAQFPFLQNKSQTSLA